MLRLNVELGLAWGPFRAADLVVPPPAPPPLIGPLDLVLVLDVTGSMTDAIAAVVAGAGEIVDAVERTTEGDYQLGLVRFQDYIDVLDDLAPGNASAVRAHLQAPDFFLGAGFFNPEGSDEALNTVLNGLRAVDRPAGPLTVPNDRPGRPPIMLGDYYQSGDFVGTFRDDAERIVVLVTDAPPGGFTDHVTPATIAHAHVMALRARARGIKLAAVFVPTTGDYAGQRAVMQDYATTSGGVFIETDELGAGLAAAIVTVIEQRARGGAE